MQSTQTKQVNRYRIYCGPTITRDVAHRLSNWDVKTTLIGTEHIYVETLLDVDKLLDILGRQGGWSYRDIYKLSPA
jgi:hypothetical protein